jgi:hypothetical protein
MRGTPREFRTVIADSLRIAHAPRTHGHTRLHRRMPLSSIAPGLSETAKQRQSSARQPTKDASLGTNTERQRKTKERICDGMPLVYTCRSYTLCGVLLWRSLVLWSKLCRCVSDRLCSGRPLPVGLPPSARLCCCSPRANNATGTRAFSSRRSGEERQALATHTSRPTVHARPLPPLRRAHPCACLLLGHSSIRSRLLSGGLSLSLRSLPASPRRLLSST